MTPDDMAAIHAAAMTVPRPWNVATFQEFLSAPGSVLTTRSVAPPSATAVEGGFAFGRVILDEAELLTIAVSPASQGQGLGRACLKAFLAECSAQGAERVFLEVAETNEAALRLYASEGFDVAGRRRAYYRQSDGPRIDAILMQRNRP